MVFLQSLESILPVIILISLGYILQIKKWFDISFSDNISKLIMNIALPASIFVSVMEYLTVDRLIKLSSGLVYVALATIFGYIIAYILVKALKIRAGRRGNVLSILLSMQILFSLVYL